MSNHAFIPLGDLMVKKRGAVDPSKFPEEDFDLFSVPAYDAQEPERLRGSEIGSSKKVVQTGDVLLSRIVPHIRRSWVVGRSNGRRQIGSGEWMIFRGKNVWPGYLRHLLMSDWFHPQLMQTVSGVGGSLLRARPAEVARIEIPLPQKNGKPDLDEQKRIAAILDKADAIRRKRQQALRLTDDFLRSVFLDIFGDPVTNPKGWDIRPFSNSLENIDSGWSPKCHSVPAAAGEWGVLKLGAVTWCSYNEAENKALPSDQIPRPQLEVQAGDLLFCRKNTHELVAAAAYVFETRPKLMIPDLIFTLRLHSDSDLHPIFLWFLLNEPHQKRLIQSLAGGAAGSMPNISKAKLNLVSLIRPTYGLQEKFASLVEHCRQTHTRGTHLQRESENLFASLQQRAFRGEL